MYLVIDLEDDLPAVVVYCPVAAANTFEEHSVLGLVALYVSMQSGGVLTKRPSADIDAQSELMSAVSGFRLLNVQQLRKTRGIAENGKFRLP